MEVFMKKKRYQSRRYICFICIFILLVGLLPACSSNSGSGSAYFRKAASIIDSVSGKDEKKETPAQPSKSTTKQSSKRVSKSEVDEAVNVILKNESSSTVVVELIDQYGGNFTASIDGGMSQNHTVKNGSQVKINGAVVHVIKSGDEGQIVVVAR